MTQWMTCQPWKKHKGTSGKLRTANHIVIKQVTWLHALIYTPLGQPAIDEDLSAMSFVNGYLAVLAEENEETKPLMVSHLQEHIEDGEAHGWSMVRSYNEAWLHNLEQG